MRVELLLDGVHPGRLGSPRDRTLRAALLKRKVKEAHGMVANMAAALGDADTANKKYREYVNTLFGQDLTVSRDAKMQEEYAKYVSKLSPTLHNDNGHLSVRGLNV